MNTRLKEYGGRWTYADHGIKRQSQAVRVARYKRQPSGRQDDYNLVQRSNVLSEAEVEEVLGVSHHDSLIAHRGVVVLNGERYGLVGKIISGGRTESMVLRMAVDESIEDGTIDYDRLATRAARIKTTAGICDVTDVSGCIVESGMLSGIVGKIKKVVGRAQKAPTRNVILSITGSVCEKTPKHFVIDWYGGGKLTIARSRAEGDWDQLNIGQWIEATISRKITGEVISALLVGTIDDPQGFSEEELAASYSSLPAADLDPVE